jgi:hypothetical protein
LASRLEAATKQFGIPILISDNLYNICSLKIQNFLRKIDCVTVKGSKVPMELYTFDGDFDVLNVKKQKKKKEFKNAYERKRHKVKYLFYKTFLNYFLNPISNIIFIARQT